MPKQYPRELRERAVFGVEPICRVLSEHGAPIAPSTYYAAKARPPSARAVRDTQLRTEITRVWKDNREVYGADKVWLELNRQGVAVARCTTERLMRSLGLQGVRRGKKIRTTVPGKDGHRAGDLLRRDFTAPAPNRRWVAGFTYVPAWCGTVYGVRGGHLLPRHRGLERGHPQARQAGARCPADGAVAAGPRRAPTRPGPDPPHRLCRGRC